MDAVEHALQLLKELNGAVTSEIIKDLINDHAPDRERMVELYERYKGTKHGVPVLTREFEDKNKVNNKLNNDYFAEIVDTKVGYFAGEPISYMLDKEAENYERASEILDQFKERNNISDIDAETAKMAAICGHGARLCYIDREGQEKVMNVDPWECVFITDMSINEPQYAMRYYKVKVKDGGSVRTDHKGARKYSERWRVEWYDDTYVTFWIQTGTGEFMQDPDEQQRPHMFNDVPLIGFPNNEEHQGDGEKVLNLIDGYDNTLSDVNSEVEQFRLAYMAFYGYEPDEETLRRAKRTGAFGLDAEGKIEFITKQMQDTVIENHLNRIEKNIYRFSKTPNFTDEAFAGSQSGEARKYKMLPFENKCITTERKFKAALRQMFKVITTAWLKKGISIDYTDIDMQFTRNFPLDIDYEAEATQKLKGMVSEKTRLSMLSFVENPEEEKEAMDEEMTVDLDEPVEDEGDEPTE